MEESKKSRRDQRQATRLAVTVWGMDLNGKLFKVKAHTLDISPTGAHLEGIWSPLHRGMIIGIECQGRRARFRVNWVGLGTGKEGEIGEIGVQCVETGRNIWGVPFKRHIGKGDAA